MSTDESTIPFPVDKLKAETLRTIAKDLGVSPTGKKEDLLRRMRVSSASGWVPPPPTPAKKRAIDEEGVETTPSVVKKIKTPPSRSRPPTRNVPTSRPVRNIPKPQPKPSTPATKKTPRSRPKPKKMAEGDNEDAEGDLDTAPPEETQTNGEVAPSIFDDYLSSGPVELFISADDILALVGELPISSPLTLWKSTPLFARRDQKSSARAHSWLIPADKPDAIMNVAAFIEANKELVDEEKSRREKRAQNKEKGINGTGEETDAVWYSLSISRNKQKDALAIKLVKAAVEGAMIAPLKDAVEENGSFWLNGPTSAIPSDADELNHIMDSLI